MIKDYFIKTVTDAINSTIKDEALGELKEFNDNLGCEKPKNPDFGDFAINISSLARGARMAPPKIAEEIDKRIQKDFNIYLYK